MGNLFSSYKIRNVEFRNRIWVSPMCQYSSVDGMPTDWHMVHLGSRAVGGAGLVVMEATAVVPEGRISPADAGIWTDDHAAAYRGITDFIRSQGSVAGIQLAHAGRKASTAEPWNGGKKVDESQGGWQVVGPSDVPFAPDYPQPRALEVAEIEQLAEDFAAAARRSVDAGFDVVELHMAHGYLFHEFLSPLSNLRSDEYGGSFENRVRFPLAAARRVRAVVPDSLPVFARISATDWADEGGWDLEQSIELCKLLKAEGIDLIDVSTGGNLAKADIPVGPSYQVPFAAAIRERAGIATAAVGMITDAKQAEEILEKGSADAIFVAREFLRDPYFAINAAKALGDDLTFVPMQYRRAI